MNLLMVRHAESEGNRAARILGQTEAPLSPKGIEQAHVLGQHLLEAAAKPTHIYYSPLQRATHTAEILRDYWATRNAVAAMIPLPELKEIRSGVLDGLTWTEAQAQYPSLCNALLASPEWIPVPGAETLKACRNRAQQVLQFILKHHSNEDHLWLISHGGFLQYLIAAVLGSNRTWGIAIPPTAIFELELDLNRWQMTDQNRWNTALWSIRRFNETSHLGST